MMQSKKSFVATKMYIIYLLASVSALIFFISEIELISGIAFLFLIVLSFTIFFIKCEFCGALFYRKTFKTHGFPVRGAEWIDKSCPCCGAERYGFVGGIKAWIKGNGKTEI